MAMLLVDEFSGPTRLQPLCGAHWRTRGIRVLVKREDERDPVLGGNKWCKLAGHLDAARQRGVTRLVSMGGCWSNHLHALAHAGRQYGFATVGLVRGEPGTVTATLEDVRAAGMHVEFVSRSTYRRRHEADWLQTLAERYGPCHVIPEGGGGAASRPGLAKLAAELEMQTAGPVLLALPVGSGTTLAGLAAALPSRFTLLGFQAYADAGLAARLATVLAGDRHAPWRLHPTPAMRSHRQPTPALAAVLAAFSEEEDIVLDTVYTVRMMAALSSLLQQGGIPDHSTVVALHTGGLQGRRSLPLAAAA